MNKLKGVLIISRIMFNASINNFTFKKNHFKKTDNITISKFLLVFSLPFFRRENNKKSDNIIDIIVTVDKLYEAQEYNKAYDTLEPLKNSKNVEILWRLSRILYQKTKEPNVDIKDSIKLIDEAYEFISRAVELDETCARVHKWKAILLSQKVKFDGFFTKIPVVHVIKYHLEKAVELDYSDIPSLYMLGTWHVEMSYLTWFQKAVLSFISKKSIEPSIEIALKYFERIEELEPRRHISNMYMLGKLNFDLKRYYRSNYYLKMAAGMDPHDERDLKYILLARALANRLKSYEFFKDKFIHDSF